MRIVVQRVNEAKVIIDKEHISGIGRGLLLLVAIGTDDTPEDVGYLANKIKNLRIFEDSNGKMNLNIKQINGEILSVSQFTLFAETRKGHRPGFEGAAKPEMAQDIWRRFNEALREDAIPVKEGRFAAKMQVQLVNDGPVTILLDSKEQ